MQSFDNEEFSVRFFKLDRKEHGSRNKGCVDNRSSSLLLLILKETLNMRYEFQSAQVNVMKVNTSSGIADVVSRDQDHGEEGLNNAGGHIAKKLSSDAPSHGTCPNNEAQDCKSPDHHGPFMRAQISHLDGNTAAE